METQFFLSNTQSPERVLVFIITDGMENASSRYTKAQVGQMIGNLSVNKDGSSSSSGLILMHLAKQRILASPEIKQINGPTINKVLII